MPGYIVQKKKKKKKEEKKRAAPVAKKCGLFSISADEQAWQPSIYAANKYI